MSLPTPYGTCIGFGKEKQAHIVQCVFSMASLNDYRISLKCLIVDLHRLPSRKGIKGGRRFLSFHEAKRWRKEGMSVFPPFPSPSFLLSLIISRLTTISDNLWVETRRENNFLEGDKKSWNNRKHRGSFRQENRKSLTGCHKRRGVRFIYHVFQRQILLSSPCLRSDIIFLSYCKKLAKNFPSLLMFLSSTRHNLSSRLISLSFPALETTYHISLALNDW